jgi:hypothetical protein
MLGVVRGEDTPQISTELAQGVRDGLEEGLIVVDE